jgi:hypothetical protein
MNYDVTVSSRKFVSCVSTDRIQYNYPVKLGDLTDVNDSNVQNNYVMIYDQSTQTYRFVPPSQVVDLADGVDDDALDYGTY